METSKINTMTTTSELCEMVLGCIPRSRAITERELIDRYDRACKRANVLALFGQLKTALGILYHAKRIKFEGEPRKVRKL